MLCSLSSESIQKWGVLLPADWLEKEVEGGGWGGGGGGANIEPEVRIGWRMKRKPKARLFSSSACSAKVQGKRGLSSKVCLCWLSTTANAAKTGPQKYG